MNAYDDFSLPIELGASIYVEVNRILVNAVKEFNLTSSAFRTRGDNIPGAALGVWDGEIFVVVQNGDSWWDIAKLLWKYGLAPVRTINLMKGTVGKFLKMYEGPVFPFSSLTQAVQDVGLLAATAATGEQYMVENGITGPFGTDVVQASTRVNYAQNLKYIHGLEAMVCMAAEGAMAVEGGNWQIFEHMIRASDAIALLETAVTGIERLSNGSYILGTTSTSEDRTTDTADLPLFDAVILAAPYQFANLSKTWQPRHVPDEIPYVKLHVTLFSSPHLLSPSFFNLPPNQAVPKAVLTTLPPNERSRPGPEGCGSPGFFSISLLTAVVHPQTGRQEYIYKIFSPEPPSTTWLARLLGLNRPLEEEADIDQRDQPALSKDAISWMYRKVWHSYPYEYPRVTFEEIKLDKGLWYTSGMESFISTMETSALSGRNVARLLVDDLIDRSTR